MQLDGVHVPLGGWACVRCNTFDTGAWTSCCGVCMLIPFLALRMRCPAPPCCTAGHTVYQLNAAGLMELQDQTWSISGFKALTESFTPTPGVSTDITQLLSA